MEQPINPEEQPDKPVDKAPEPADDKTEIRSEQEVTPTEAKTPEHTEPEPEPIDFALENGAPVATEATEEDGEAQEALLDKQINRRRFIAFGTFTVMAGVAYGGWRWLYTSPVEKAGITGNAHQPLRRALNKNELFFRKLFYSERHLVKTYPKEMAAKHVRVNSDVGLKSKFDPKAWALEVKRKSGEVLKVTLDDLRALPKTEIVYDFKCVEGWDQISHWGGVKFADFVAHYQLQDEAKMQYVGMETPDKQYYIGLDTPSAIHPQTLLAYEMNERLLPPENGAPLRLIIPVKYGIKNMKRIGTITFSDERPRDYWAELGYDYYSGL